MDKEKKAGAGQTRVRAMFDYTGQEDSELSFVEGDIILVENKDPSGWWKGTLGAGGKSGLFPSNYVEIIGN
ncbi:protein kinase C and casein kinase substrate in neurons protein [Pelomyxa schiedti]|nr:protein kinase C and casein kinase substrate in neurons protein [Pelomyxa schiedti]